MAQNQAQQALDFLKASGTPYTDAEAAHLAAAMQSGAWSFVLAAQNGTPAGAFYLNRTPKYRPYQALNIPEMQDLRVLPAFRRRGIARALVTFAENLAKADGAGGLGISVGLTSDFGPAQCLYAAMGYMPDGNGITIDRQPAQKNARITLNDDACLMLLKLF